MGEQVAAGNKKTFRIAGFTSDQRQGQRVLGSDG